MVQPAAESGSAEAQSILGNIYLYGGNKNCQEALKWLGLAAAQGDVSAMSNLGEIYQYAWKGCPKQTEAKAVAWYTQAAERGYYWAQIRLGEIYRDGGDYVEQNDAEAVKWFRLAAQRGYKPAMEQLKKIHQYSRLVTKEDIDEVKLFWFLGEKL